MKHRASPRFWRNYRALPDEIQQLADRGHDVLLHDPRHRSSHYKRIERFWSARVSLHHRALATGRGGAIVWVWIGTHAEYDMLLRRKGQQRDAADSR